ncbi:MAG: hypothetical protein ACE5LU_26690 [Anaerolineae bacterium]
MNAQQLQRILQAILLTEDAELTCAGLDEERLTVYADVKLAGHDPAQRMPDVYRHLALCPDCRRDYRDILATLRLEKGGHFMEPGSDLRLDLSFLAVGTRELAPWSQVAERVRRYTTELPVLMLHEFERLGELPAGLRLRPAAGAPAKMRGPAGDTPVVAFRLTDAKESLAVDLRFRRAGEDVVWIAVRPLDAQSENSLPGAIVALHDGDGRLLEMRTVPADGAIQLRDVPINRTFLLRLEHDARTWEVPFSLHIEASGKETTN